MLVWCGAVELGPNYKYFDGWVGFNSRLCKMLSEVAILPEQYMWATTINPKPRIQSFNNIIRLTEAAHVVLAVRGSWQRCGSAFRASGLNPKPKRCERPAFPQLGNEGILELTAQTLNPKLIIVIRLKSSKLIIVIRFEMVITSYRGGIVLIKTFTSPGKIDWKPAPT